jgi:hypothetical protein
VSTLPVLSLEPHVTGERWVREIARGLDVASLVASLLGVVIAARVFGEARRSQIVIGLYVLGISWLCAIGSQYFISMLVGPGSLIKLRNVSLLACGVATICWILAIYHEPGLLFEGK